MDREIKPFKDHDQRFKTLLREFLPEFFELFFPEWAARFDFTRTEWLDKEIFPDPPEGKRRSLDLVAKLPTVDNEAGPEEWLSLIHVEIESSDSVEPLRRRMHRYYTHLRDEHELPVLPIALYLRVGLEGIGFDEFRDGFGSLELLVFRYLYVGLPALDAVEYMQKNDLGVAMASLMKTPDDDRAALRAAMADVVIQMDRDEYRRYLLFECIETYMVLNEEQQAEYERLLKTEQFQGAARMATTSLEKGLEQGLEQGLQQGLQQGAAQGRREMIQFLIEDRFGALSGAAKSRLDGMDDEELREVARKLFSAKSFDELGLSAEKNE